MKKEMMALRKLPTLMWPLPTLMMTLLKSGLPMVAAMSGLSTSPTRAVTMALKAAPMMTATARSTTFPRRTKSRKPLNINSSNNPGESAARDQGERDRGFCTILHGRRWFLKGIEAEKQHQGQDQKLGVEQDEDAGVVEAPFAPQAAGGLHHPPADEGHDKNLPKRGVQVVGIRKAFKAQAGREGGEGEQDAAEQGFRPRAKDGGTGQHHTSYCRQFAPSRTPVVREKPWSQL